MKKFKLFLTAYCILLLYTPMQAQPFQCDGKLYFFREDTSGGNKYLSYIDNYTSTPIVQDVCVVQSNGNALGANPSDGYLYYTTGANLTRLDANCNDTTICPITTTIRGCFDHLGRYWVVQDNGNLEAYDMSCNLVKGPFSISLPASSFDIAFNMSDCHFYMGDASQVIRIDTNGVVVNTYSPGFVNSTGSYGGVAIGADGNLYGMTNGTSSTLVKFDINTQTADTIFSFTPGSGNTNSDMASFPCPTLKASFAVNPDTSCGSLKVSFTDSSTGLVNSWLWTYGDGNTDTVQNPVHTYASAGTYNVSLTVTAKTNCISVPPDNFTTSVTVPSSSTNVTINPVGTLCLSDTATTLTATPSGGIWSGNGIINTDSGIFDPTTAGLGTHTIIYTITSTCDDTISISVISKPIISIGVDDTLLCGATTTLDAGSGYNYQWNDGSTKQTFTVSSAGNYSVTVSVGNCSATDFILFAEACPNSELSLPNVFTPNNDGNNDTFKALGTNVSEYHLKIYNRWGELIFESNAFRNEWDGTYNGQSVPDGVYYWVLEYKGYENNSTTSEELTGTVTVLKGY